MRYKAAIFDLDGVLVDTAKYHYLAWKQLADTLGFAFTPEDNERLKGVSRMESLEILLQIGGLSMTPAEKEEAARWKNERYVAYIQQVDDSELLPGARDYLLFLRENGVRTALGSASRNARPLLQSTGLLPLFDAVVDGNDLSRAKPDPEVFLLAAARLGAAPGESVVFEDAAAGIEAAKRGGMAAIGVGREDVLSAADAVIGGLYEAWKVNALWGLAPARAL